MTVKSLKIICDCLSVCLLSLQNQFTRQHNGQQVISIELVFDPVLPEHHGAYTCHIGMNSVTSPEQFLIAVDTGMNLSRCSSPPSLP